MCFVLQVVLDMNVVFALSDICGQDRNGVASVLLKVFRDERRVSFVQISFFEGENFLL